MLTMLDTLCARLCHEMDGRVGTLVGALEMTAEEAGRGQGVMLAESTVSGLGHRLRLLRAAWTTGTEAMEPGRLLQLAAGLARRQTLEIDLSGLTPNTSFTPAGGRVMANILLLAGEALPEGGAIIVSGHPQGDVVTMLIGPQAAWPAGFAACLADPEVIAAQFAQEGRLQAGMTALVARSLGLRLSLLFGPPTQPPPLLLAAGGAG